MGKDQYIEILGKKEYLNKKGERHREDGPAVIWDSGRREWWLNGKLHRIDGPAIETADGSKEWWVNDERHREDGPAVERGNGIREWWVNGRRHRIGAPAIEDSLGNTGWYVNGMRHREDGPALDHGDGWKEWWVNGKQIRVVMSEPENIRRERIMAEIQSERMRQIEKEGYTQEHDDSGHGDRDLASAGACYAYYASIFHQPRTLSVLNCLDELWPWDMKDFKPTNPRRNLIKAAALILAELERLDRKSQKRKVKQ